MHLSERDGDPGYPVPPQQIPSPHPTSAIATASLVFGIIGLVGSWCLFGLPSIAAIALGHAARRQTKRGLGSGGHGMAVAGLVLGYVAALPGLLVSLIVVLLFTDPVSLAEWINTMIGWFG
ncbi:DUF4190 domain-containing protein [Nonomuraea jiangxiensis]|uniref:DUF4190 domain-containing protein n=1 Tax=Nonomuraea jiangxiensis TaxID=633440 RepID=A0A1G9ARD0_9ACTN|nr:DUF4190 domain-containing protein [Nonomuraea jiangxiensis]SDK29791.1 protein of unknown function [Nonomuraea jiangxiensis]